MPKGYKNWQFILYTESMQPNALQLLPALGYSGYISPLHDADMWTDEDEKDNPDHVSGTRKKAHYHIIVCLSCCYQNANKVINDIIVPISMNDKANKYAEPVHYMPESVRYFTHIDFPNKHQYDKKDIICFGRFHDVTKYFNDQNESDIYAFVESIIIGQQIYRLSTLVSLLTKMGRLDALDLVRRKHFYFMNLIRENYHINTLQVK